MMELKHRTIYAFDDAMIATEQRLVRRWLPATVAPDPVLQPDRPWEGRCLALYGTVLPRTGGGWRLYYNEWKPPFLGPDSRVVSTSLSRLMVAESDDGLHWEKPDLGLVELPGVGARNNVCIDPPNHLDSPSLIHDPDDTAAPYKLMTFEMVDREPWWNDSWGLYRYTSSDGLRWTRRGYCLKAGDRTNLMATRPGGQYVLYTRSPDMHSETGGRAVYRAVSEDFVTWSAPELVLRPDLDDEPGVEFYGMSVFERHGWFLGLLEYWRSDVDVIETHLAISRDGRQWQRPCRKPFIAATCDWNRAWSSCASNGPIMIGEQMAFLFGGRRTSHHFDSVQLAGAIGVASLPCDRFCCLEGQGGFFETPTFIWPGGDLVVNADTRHNFQSHPLHCNGALTVEVLDAEGHPAPEWSGADQARFQGNTHCRCRIFDGTVRWSQGRTLAAWQGRTLRLRFRLDQAQLFTWGCAV